MAEPLKNMFNQDLISNLGNILSQFTKDFNTEQFINDVFDDRWEALELKERMQHITKMLSKQLPENYDDAIDILLKLTECVENYKSEISFAYMVLPTYVELYGTNHLQTSIKAMERVTQLVSCEFAVRPYILKYPQEMMQQMLQWSTHPHQNVRRFASEGCRPRLPWAMALPELKKDPTSILPILENLKNDDSEFVRKSVANNLNDISKDHPELVLEIASQWKGKSKNTDWIIKHACRTLLKQAHLKAMELFGYNFSEHIEVTKFKVNTPKVIFGNHLEFGFTLANKDGDETMVRLEYAIYFKKANGSLAKKVFKISEKKYSPNSSTNIKRKHNIKPITTRKYYSGLHQVSLIVNGKELEKNDFELEM